VAEGQSRPSSAEVLGRVIVGLVDHNLVLVVVAQEIVRNYAGKVWGDHFVKKKL
jgi:hypothetical protein